MMNKQIFGTVILTLAYFIVLSLFRKWFGIDATVILGFSIVISNQFMNKPDGE